MIVHYLCHKHLKLVLDQCLHKVYLNLKVNREKSGMYLVRHSESTCDKKTLSHGLTIKGINIIYRSYSTITLTN